MNRSVAGSALCERIQQRARQAPNSPAITDRHAVTTFEGLWREATVCASLLRTQGIAPGHPVGLLCSNRAQFVEALLGIASVGAIAILLPAALPPELLQEYCRTAALRFAFVEHGFRQSLRSANARLVTEVQPGLEAVTIDGPARDNPPRDSFIGQLTSGVDAPPKIAIRSFAAVWDEIEVIVETIGLNASDSVFVLSPISHSYGLIGGTLAPLCQGARVMLGDSLPAADAMRIARRLRPTVLFGIPKMYTDVVATATAPAKMHLSSLRLCLSAGAPLSSWINERFHACFGHRIMQDYGSTEAGTITLQLQWTPELAGSVGRPLRGRTITIADTHGRRAAAGKVGEIVVHSPGLARWYLESLGPAPLSGAFATGDLGRLDNGGHLFLVGRKGSLIHASGRSIDPAVIEAVIGQMRGVRDVAAVGVPTSTGEDRIKAVVVSEAVTTARILEYCHQHLPQACVPDIVQFCDEIPRTPAGKVLRRILREPPRC